MSGFLLDVIKTVGSVAVISGLAVWLTRNIITQFFSRNIEQFKHDLEKEALVHKVRYEKMHGERAEVIKQLYQRIVRTHRSFGSFISPVQMTGEASLEEKGKIAATNANDFTEYYEENKIFLDRKLTEKIDVLSKTFRSAWIKFTTSQWIKDYSDEKLKYWDESWKIIDGNVPGIRTEIEEDFRKILGVK